MVSEHAGAVAWLVAGGITRGAIAPREESQTTVKRDESLRELRTGEEAVGTLFFLEVPVSMRRMQAASRVAVFFCSRPSATFSWHAAT